MSVKVDWPTDPPTKPITDQSSSKSSGGRRSSGSASDEGNNFDLLQYANNFLTEALLDGSMSKSVWRYLNCRDRLASRFCPTTRTSWLGSLATTKSIFTIRMAIWSRFWNQEELSGVPQICALCPMAGLPYGTISGFNCSMAMAIIFKVFANLTWAACTA